MNRVLLRVLLLSSLAILGATSTDPAIGEEVGAPSTWVEEIETPQDGAGMMGEVDAARAQAEAGTVDDPATGLSPRTQARVEEIVVQARKRAERIEDTPVSVTALSEATLREAGVQRLDQIRELVPNLQFTSRRNVEADVRIRGIGASTGEIAFDPGAGIFVDGVFLSRSFGGLLDVMDIAQIEVLRGPQGTLFGKNTIGGAVNISTVRPHGDLEGFVFLRPGNFGSLTTRVMLNVPIDVGPLEDRVFLRVALASDNSDGYTHNVYRDTYSNNMNSLSFLGTLRVLPTDDITIDISGSWSSFHNNGKGGQCRVIQPTVLQDLAEGFAEQCELGEPFRFSANTHNLVDVKSFGTWGTFNWDLGDLGPFEDVSVKSITSWRKQLPRRRHDFDMTKLPVLSLSNVGGSPYDGVPGYQQQISQELQTTGTAFDQLSYVAGYFAFWEQADTRSVTEVHAGPIDAVQDDTDQIDNWNWAFFGQATWDMTDWAALTAGVRYTEEKKGITIVNRLGANVESNRPEEQVGSNSAIFTAWTPMASVSLMAPDNVLDVVGLDHLLGYFTFSRGFKGGGFNAVLGAVSLDPFGPEYLNSYEIGFKTISFDQRLIVNLSLFTGDYDDIQVATLIDAGEPNENDVPDLQRVILNAASATTRGVELELQANPIEGLQFTGSLGYIDARYNEYEGISDLTGLEMNRDGQAFDEVPKFQSYLSVQYSLPVSLGEGSSMSGWVTPRLDWSYSSAISYSGPEIPEATQRGVNLLHARISYDFFDDRAQVALWAQNLLNESYFNHVNVLASSFGTIVRYYESPRTWGGELSFRF